MNNLSKILLVLFVFLCGTVAIAADAVTGTVHNQTTDKPAVGDDVVLLRLGQGMQEESRTKTDAQGAFTLSVTSPQDQHVVQVFHQGVNYNQTVTSAAPLQMTVYDAIAEVPGLSGSLGFAKLDSDGKVLRVTELYVITNRSNPPVTQSKPDNFEITVPEKATLESVEVKSGKGILVKVPPVPMKGQRGKYSINFPIRPGETLFTYVYRLPYPGSTTLRLKLPYPIAQFGVMHPSTMSFKPLQQGTFRSGTVSPGLIGEALVTPGVGDVPAFQISGAGQAALHGTEPVPVPQQAPAISAAPSNAPHGTPANPPSPADQSKKELYLMIGGILVILALGVFALWRMNQSKRPAIVGARPASGKPLLDALKEELFQLESDRLHGSISLDEYAATKQALSKSIERAMGKNQ